MRSVTLPRVVLGALLLVALSLAGASSALANTNDTAETAITVSAENGSVGGTIVGGSGSIFRYYRFSYPGADTPVHIHLSWNPGWGATDKAFNFHLYGPNGLVGQGIRGDDAGPASTSNLTLKSQVAGDYLVQVYNYTPSLPVAFNLDFTGLSAGPVRVEEVASPDGVVELLSRAPVLTGSLPGTRACSYAYFTMEYPGVDREATISLTGRPGRWLPEGSFGFNVFDGSTLVESSKQTFSNADLVTMAATVKRFQPGPMVIQVYNCVEGVTAEYTLGINGAAGSILKAGANDTPQAAPLLSSSVTSARGTLGGGGSTFHYYGFNYQGGNKPITLSMQFSPSRALTGGGVGFNIYRGHDLMAQSLLADGRNHTESTAYLTFKFDQAGYYGVQVYSYAPNAMPVDYTFHVMGLE